MAKERKFDFAPLPLVSDIQEELDIDKPRRDCGRSSYQSNF
jgi:hypothetical protein